MKLLFITQKLHEQDVFTILWINAFAAKGYHVDVICLEERLEEAKKTLGDDIPFYFTVHTLGKNKGVNKSKQIQKFWLLIASLKYDRVFIHMSPVWGLLGAWLWPLKGVPVYLWYTHYKMQLGLLLLGWYGKRLFCATKQSLPQYNKSPKKIVTGHGIDMHYWPKRDNAAPDRYKLLIVHRLSRSKRVELNIRALTHLPEQYTIDIYGISAEQDYVDELHALVEELNLGESVSFNGTAAATILPDIYTSHRLILNMASETIDKTMLEAMTCGCYPLTTRENAKAIGISEAPRRDTPEDIAGCIERYSQQSPLNGEEMYAIVKRKHSLRSLVDKMDTYINPGL